MCSPLHHSLTFASRSGTPLIPRESIVFQVEWWNVMVVDGTVECDHSLCDAPVPRGAAENV